MNFDFNLILVPITLLLLVLWLLDKLVFKQRKKYGKGNERFLIRTSYEFLPLLLGILVLRSFIIEPFVIPSSSMVPTLYTGDFIAVNKMAYGMRLPITHTKIIDSGSPEHGDVAVFRYPADPNMYYVKRIIGLPGDTVAYNQGIISINGKPLETTAVSQVTDKELTSQLIPAGAMYNNRPLSPEQAKTVGLIEEEHATYYQEKPSNHQYIVRYLDGVNASQYGNFLRQTAPEVIDSKGSRWQIQVPPDHYLTMGDNRDRSADSRFWGFVPEKNLAGKAVYIWMHKMPGLNMPSFSRSGAID